MRHSPLEVRDLSVAYQKKPVLLDVSFEVPARYSE
ncbi:UNVERIFIED_CONTAM: ABC-type Mn2+/Zn2+ transport system ATPase subunit [Paenibacillus sp. PvR008]